MRSRCAAKSFAQSFTHRFFFVALAGLTAGALRKWRLAAVAALVAATVSAALEKVEVNGVAEAAFKRWLVIHNVTTLETTLEWPVESLAGRSARARVRIRAGTPVCHIDPLLAMTTLLYDSNPRLRSLAYQIDTEEGTQEARLALVLLVEMEKGERSFWAPYLGILPLNPLPTHDAKDLAEFQDGMLIEHLERAAAEEARQWKGIHKAMDAAKDRFNKSVFNFGRFQWARRITLTRAFALWGRRQVYLYALVPVCDLLNHNGSRHWHMSSPYYPTPVPDPWLSDRQAQIHCTHDVAAGDQVFNDYHYTGLANLYFVAMYGFVPERNDYDVLFLPGDRAVSASMDPVALQQWCAENIPATSSVVAGCLHLFQSELNKMPTTLEADLQLLAQRGHEASTSLSYRISRKRMFAKHIGVLRQSVGAGNGTDGTPFPA